mgnify:CR=1 FL=1
MKAVEARGHGDFFAIDRSIWADITKLGINASVAYLVMARGTGRDQRTTSWSTNAIEERTGISRPRAKEAIARLVSAGFVAVKKPGSRPSYDIGKRARTGKRSPIEAPQTDWVWLPNALVDSAAGEPAPIELCRQSANTGALFLLVELYHAQALQFFGGLPHRDLRQNFERHELARRGPYVVWGFHSKGLTASSTVYGGFISTLPNHDQDAAFVQFWAALQVLRDTGLLVFVPHVFNTGDPEGEPMHPYGWNDGQVGEPEEQAIAANAHAAARAMLVALGKPDVGRGHMIPVLRHIANVSLIGVARLRYRPRTTATANWYDPAKWAIVAEKYAALQHQGDLNGSSKGSQGDIS